MRNLSKKQQSKRLRVSINSHLFRRISILRHNLRKMKKLKRQKEIRVVQVEVLKVVALQKIREVVAEIQKANLIIEINVNMKAKVLETKKIIIGQDDLDQEIIETIDKENMKTEIKTMKEKGQDNIERLINKLNLVRLL